MTCELYVDSIINSTLTEQIQSFKCSWMTQKQMQSGYKLPVVVENTTFFFCCWLDFDLVVFTIFISHISIDYSEKLASAILRRLELTTWCMIEIVLTR